MDSLRRPQSQRSSPGSERFLGLFSASPPSPSSGGAELLEDDVLFSPSPERDRSYSQTEPSLMLSKAKPNPILGGAQRGGLGILAALREDGSKRPPPAAPPLQQRRSFSLFSASSASPSPSAARAIPSIPKPKPEFSLSVPSGKVYHQSAPVNVPVAQPRWGSRGAEIERGEDEDGDEDEMMPPHEMLARRASSRNSPMTTFSVLEGAGRTLKGRDLRTVRNAVFRQTGFLD